MLLPPIYSPLDISTKSPLLDDTKFNCCSIQIFSSSLNSRQIGCSNNDSPSINHSLAILVDNSSISLDRLCLVIESNEDKSQDSKIA